MTTVWPILINLLLTAVTAVIVIVDLKAIRWIEKGGLKSKKRRFFLIYLPLAVWTFCFMAPRLMASPEVEQYLRIPFLFLGGVYGIAFILHYFIGDFLTNDHIRSMFIGGFIILATLCDGAGFLRVNTTSSMPRGIYTLSLTEEKPRRGDLVTFCLGSDNSFTALAKERGYVGSGTCPSGMKPLLKNLAGLPGDELEIAPDGLILNGDFLHLSFRPEIDSQGRKMPPSLLQNGKIPEGQGLVLSQEHGNSFDSRHFGLAPLNSLTRVEPVLTFESESKSDGQNR